jgi:hypothetical protein
LKNIAPLGGQAAAMARFFSIHKKGHSSSKDLVMCAVRFAGMMNRMKILSAAVILAMPLLITAQQSFNEAQVRRVIAYAQAYRENLPSLECDEAMLSQRVRNGKVKWEVKIKATLRESRDENEPGGFRDEYTFKSVDGRPAKRHFKTPYFVYNVFANSLGIGASPRPKCFDYRFSTLDGGRTLQFNIDSKQGVQDPSCNKIPDEYHKMMLIDTASNAVRHVERHISPQFADDNLEIPDVTIDYAPEQLGDETFWLPTRFEANDLHQEGRMIANYSNCHRYIGIPTILP